MKYRTYVDGVGVINCIWGTDNCQIKDSYKVKARNHMIRVINCLIQEGVHPLEQRSNRSLIGEWRLHNLFYDFGLFRSHTQDVDFETQPRTMLSIIYSIIGT